MVGNGIKPGRRERAADAQERLPGLEAAAGLLDDDRAGLHEILQVVVKRTAVELGKVRRVRIGEIHDDHVEATGYRFHKLGGVEIDDMKRCRLMQRGGERFILARLRMAERPSLADPHRGWSGHPLVDHAAAVHPDEMGIGRGEMGHHRVQIHQGHGAHVRVF